jgi:shikimate dehydrogenase
MGIPYAEVIGDPIAHSKSPLIHKFWLEKLGIEGDYRATRVTADQLPDYLAARRVDPDWRGCSVTTPHKQAIIRHIDDLDVQARRVGAVNAVTRNRTKSDRTLTGFNTDVAGFAEPLEPLLSGDSDRRRALQIGAGGAGRAVAFALAKLGFEPLVINRDPEKARELTAAAGGAWWDDLRIYDLSFNRDLLLLGDATTDHASLVLVNATPLGMTGYPPLDVTLDGVSDHVIVYDLVYAPSETALLANARRRGMKTIGGVDMLIGQAAMSCSLFFQASAPRQHDAELREQLTA